MSEPNLYDALGGEGEVLERVEQLPWKSTWAASSNILRLAFCETSRVPQLQRPGVVFPYSPEGLSLGWMWVQFRSGKVYAYQDVPKASYEAIITAESPGRAHIALIRGHYRHVSFDPQTGATS